jgi:hypothetical protein
MCKTRGLLFEATSHTVDTGCAGRKDRGSSLGRTLDLQPQRIERSHLRWRAWSVLWLSLGYQIAGVPYFVGLGTTSIDVIG